MGLCACSCSEKSDRFFEIEIEIKIEIDRNWRWRSLQLNQVACHEWPLTELLIQLATHGVDIVLSLFRQGASRADLKVRKTVAEIAEPRVTGRRDGRHRARSKG